jgi:hypothetical protein
MKLANPFSPDFGSLASVEEPLVELPEVAVDPAAFGD